MSERGLVLDTGALIAFERNDRRVVTIVARALERGATLVVPAGVIAQAWRDGRAQVRLARLLGSSLCAIVAVDDGTARAVGQQCGVSGVDDIVDVSVALAGRQRRLPILTSDPADIRLVDSRLDVVPV